MKLSKGEYNHHFEDKILIPAKPKEIFSYIDDHKNFSSHMNNPSMMMFGSTMKTMTDSRHGKMIGSHIKMKGKIMGIKLNLDEVVTERIPSKLKIWETIGAPKLLIIENYRMKARIIPKNKNSVLIVSIDYTLSKKNKWLGKLFGGFYARWCVKQMIFGTKDHFSKMESHV